jgi:hypothetical protein
MMSDCLGVYFYFRLMCGDVRGNSRLERVRIYIHVVRAHVTGPHQNLSVFAAQTTRRTATAARDRLHADCTFTRLHGGHE